ncbi:MAG: DUF459 domain-containing protein [Xanthobacteraceae bacterium]
MFPTVLSLVGKMLGAALLVGLSDVQPAIAQFFDFFQRPPPATGETYQRQRTRIPQQSYGYGFGWGGQPDSARPNLDQPRFEPPTYEPRRTYERRRKSAPRKLEPQQVQQEDFSKAPPPSKPAIESNKKVVVLGDAMADWLAYGLEDALSDFSEELGVVRKHRTPSGLISSDRQDYDWVQGARDVVTNQKADLFVIMIGQSDRRAIQDRPGPLKTSQSTAQKSGETPQNSGNTPRAPSETPKPPEAFEGATEAQNNSTDRATTGVAAGTSPSETEHSAPSLTYQFRSDKWAELYAKRIDQLITVLKTKNVPILWVGLPPIRGTRSQRDMAYLNDRFKARAERAGFIYVDIWDGFVDDDGDYASYGPDVGGQVRRLRTSDGMYFTQAGARKLAFYVEREIRRLISRETPVALPVPEKKPKPAGVGQPRAPAPRPIAGPVIPLTPQQSRGETGALLGVRPELDVEPLAAKVLLKGESLESTKGRADDFSWPPAAASADDIIDSTASVAVNRPVPSGKSFPGPKGERKKTDRSDRSQSRQTDGHRSSMRSH